MDKPIGPAARTIRFLAITPTVAGMILWAARSIEARPWTVIRFLWRDALASITGHEFWFNGRWITPGSPQWLYQSYEHIAASWKASAAVGLALFLGGLASYGVNRLVVRLHRNPSQ